LPIPRSPKAVPRRTRALFATALACSAAAAGAAAPGALAAPCTVGCTSDAGTATGGQTHDAPGSDTVTDAPPDTVAKMPSEPVVETPPDPVTETSPDRVIALPNLPANDDQEADTPTPGPRPKPKPNPDGPRPGPQARLTWDAQGHPGLPVHGVWEGDCGGGLVTVVFRLSEPLPYNVDLDWATEGDTATAGVDFESSSGHVTIPAGQTTATITVKVLSDMTPEGGYQTNESFFVRVRNVTPGADAVNSSGFIAIVDDDPAGMPPDCSHPETSINDKDRPGATSMWEATSTLPQARESQTAATVASVLAASAGTGATARASVLKFKRFSRAGRPMFRIDCESSPVPCLGKVLLRAGTLAAGSASFGIDAGQAGYVTIPINSRIKRLIGRRGRLAMTTIIIVSGKATATSAFTARFADLNPQPLPPKAKSKRHRNGDDRSLNPQPLPPKEKKRKG
jgi:hypothetical protein